MLSLWLVVAFWMAVSIRACLKPSRRVFKERPSSRQTSLVLGLGWIQVDSPALNDLPLRLLASLGVFPSSYNLSSGKNPKSFDDTDWDHPELFERSRPKNKSFGLTKRSVLNAMYDVGAVACVFGVIVALLLLFYLLICILSELWYFEPIHPNQQPHAFEKPPSFRQTLFNASRSLLKRAAISIPESRDLKSSFQIPPQRPSSQDTQIPISGVDHMFLQLAIPGFTIPLSYLPIYLSALIICQAIHEFGHALVATLNAFEIQSVGFYILFPCIPVCYVNITDSQSHSFSWTKKKVIELKKVRVATAGVWHNLVLAFLSWLIWSDGGNFFNRTIGHVFWANISSSGVMVAQIDQTSPLAPLVSCRDIIVQIDDYILADKSALRAEGNDAHLSSEKWSEYLLQAPDSFENFSKTRARGWCIDNHRFQKNPLTCCEVSVTERSIYQETPKSHLCFHTLKIDRVNQKGCLSAADITSLMQSQRCTSTLDCTVENTCIQLDSREDLVRLYVLADRSGKLGTVFYNGPKYSLWKEVRISHLKPRYELFRTDLIILIHEFFGFILSISIGLAFMNLLPIRRLDGSAICESFVTLLLLPNPLDDEPSSPSGYSLDLRSIGHARPVNPGTHINELAEIKSSLLFKFWKFCDTFSYQFFKIKSSSLGTFSIHDKNLMMCEILEKKEKLLRTLYFGTTCISFIVLIGITIQSLKN